MTQPTPPTSALENFTLGAFSGLAAITCEQPFIYVKNTQQHNAALSAAGAKPIPIKWDPRCCYRGFKPSAMSAMLPVSFQTALYEACASMTSPAPAAAVTGIVSSLCVVCPAELIMNQQQHSGEPFLHTACKIHANHGILGFWRGNIPTMVRETPPVFGWAYAAPILKKRWMEQGVPEYPAQVMAGIAAGTPAALLTHPFDTAKTQRQRDFSVTQPLPKALVQKGAFAGVGWRWMVIVLDCTIIPFVQEKLKKFSC
jgi:hypothetical protein